MYVQSSTIRLHTVIAIEIFLNEHLLKCLALFQERLSREWAIIGPPAKRHFICALLADVCRGV